MSWYTGESIESVAERYFQRLDARFEIAKADHLGITYLNTRPFTDPMVDAINDARFAAWVRGELKEYP